MIDALVAGFCSPEDSSRHESSYIAIKNGKFLFVVCFRCLLKALFPWSAGHQSALVEQQIDVVTLIGKMGAQLTSVDDLVRSRGTLLLASVLNDLPSLKLTSQQLS